MATSNMHSGKQQALIIIKIQAVVVILATIVLQLAVGFQSAYSALFGGLIALIPTWYFANKLFTHSGARAIKQIVSSLYVAEGMKLLMTAGLFVVVFKTFSLSPLVFFAVFIATQGVFWLAPVLLKGKVT